ncbi:MAG: HAD family acid phosphatase [Gammaproteobacteria bacterium]|jgi:predicted secreted acid phosphatase
MIKRLFCYLSAVITAVLLTQTSALAEPANLGLLKQELVRYYDSGQYLKEITAVATQATDYIQKEVALNQHQTSPKRLAIVLDIDETSLSNYANMQQDDFANNPAKISEELLAAEEPAIQPMLDLYQQAVQNDIAVFFITGRDQSFRDATIQNLRAAGYTQWSGLSFKNGKIPTIAYKTAERAKISQQGYTIIASFGDQDSDFVGGYAQRTFKLPNPFYYLP